jgi:hypothetical protein
MIPTHHANLANTYFVYETDPMLEGSPNVGRNPPQLPIGFPRNQNACNNWFHDQFL